jgi:hypothetical protein
MMPKRRNSFGSFGSFSISAFLVACQNLVSAVSHTPFRRNSLVLASNLTLEATEIPKKNARKKKVKIDGKPVTEATSMVEKNNKNGVASFSDNLSDTSREDKAESLLKNLVNHSKILMGLTANTTPLI